MSDSPGTPGKASNPTPLQGRASTLPPTTPEKSTPRRTRNRSEDWEDEVDDCVEEGSAGGESRYSASRPYSYSASSPVSRRRPKSGRSSPAVKSPTKKKNAASPRPTPQSSSTKLRESNTVLREGAFRPKERQQWLSENLGWSLSILRSTLTTTINLIHTILSPFYPYIFLTALALLTFSLITYALLNVLPSLLFQLPALILRLILPTWNSSPSFSSADDAAIGKNLALFPLRSLATPICTMTGQLCMLSLLTSSHNGTIESARPFWAWNLKKRKEEVDIGEVARSLTKEAKGAKDIFESIALLSGGGIMDRLEYVRIWELGTAIQVGSNLGEKHMVSEQLFELGNIAKDLSDELVDTNAMAVDAFTWLQWEFSSLVKVLLLPPHSRPSAAVLSKRLNDVLNRLSATLTSLHKLASSAHTLAARGSSQGRTLRTHLDLIGADLNREREKEPGWKLAVEKSKHFILGGEQSPAQRLARDLELTTRTIFSLKDLVTDLEGSRSAIKGFRDQIGYFDASLMGFHLGASGFGDLIGPEEEVRVLAEVVEEFGRSVGRAKSVGRRGEGRVGIEGAKEL